MRVCLVYPPATIMTTSCAPPMGLAYLASILKQKGAEVYIVSSAAEGLDTTGTISRILDLSPDIIGISVLTPMVNNSLKIIENIKKYKNDVKIIVGGPHATIYPEAFLTKNADFVIRGEGEKTLSDLHSYFNNETSLEDIKGISYKENDNFIHNADRELIEDIDSLPFPMWELFPIKRYWSHFRKKKFSLPILSSRGCPAQCTFCYKAIFGDKFRARDPECVVDEIEYLKYRFGIEEFAIIDDSFTSNIKRTIEINELIISRNINLPWTLPSGIRVSTVTKELLESLKAAGCYRIALGIESGSQQILNSIKKGTTVEQAKKAVKLLSDIRIKSMCYFMVGNLDETEHTIEQTINFALELNSDFVQFSKTIPFPGTQIYKQLKEENNITKGNWDNYDCFLKSKPIFTHNHLSSEEIDNKVREAYRRFYLRPKIILKHLSEITSLSAAINFIKNIFKFFKIYAA